MASTDVCSQDLSTDNFEFLNIRSLPFPSGDLALMARMSGLLDVPPKASGTDTYLACQLCPVQSAAKMRRPIAQAQQLRHVQHQVLNVCPVSTSDYAYYSQSVSPQPNNPQPTVPQPGGNQQTNPQQTLTKAFSAKQSDIPLYPQHLAHTGTPAQTKQTPFALASNASFDSDDSQQRVIKAEHPDTCPSAEQADVDNRYAATPRRSTRKRQATEEWLQQKKKVGRPITYNGDPNASELTEAERRTVKRRVANRESARRVQQRRKEMIDELQHKLLYFQHHHQHLVHYVAQLEMEKGQIAGQLTDMEGQWAKGCADTIALTAQLHALQQQQWQQQQGCQQDGPEIANPQQSWGSQQGPSTPSKASHRHCRMQKPQTMPNKQG